MDLITKESAIQAYEDSLHGKGSVYGMINNCPSAFEGKTNREVIEALFPNIVEYNRDEYHSTLAIRGEGKDIVLPISFLDSPYKGVSE